MEVKNTWLFAGPIAHRGLHDETAPENSLPAFEKAAARGYAAELDVHLIDDGNLIVFHDDVLGRMTGTDGYAATLKTADLENLRLGNTDEKIPTFERLLEVVNGRIPLLIETKTTGKVGELERRLWETLKTYKGEYAVQSFDPYSMEFFRNHAPDVLRGQLSCVVNKKDMSFLKRSLLTSLKVNRLSQPHFVSYNWCDLPSKYVTRTGLPTLGWTVRSNTEAEQAEKVCDNIIFENFIPEARK